MLATIAILRTVIAVLIPACLVHRMAAFHYNLVVNLKRFLTQIARLCHDVSAKSHVMPGIAQHIFVAEILIVEVRYHVLQHYPDEACNDDGNNDSYQHNHRARYTVNNNRVIEVANVDEGRERGDERVSLLTVDIYVQRLKAASVDLSIRILKDEFIGIRTDGERFKNAVLEFVTIVGTHVDAIGHMAETLQNQDVLRTRIVFCRIHACVAYRHIRIRMVAALCHFLFKGVMVRVNRHVSVVVIYLRVRECQQRHSFGICPHSLMRHHLIVFLNDGTIQEDMLLLHCNKVLVEHIFRSGD